MRLTGKRIVVTGAGSGIGRATAALFAHEGASVIVADWHEADAVETVTAIVESGGTAIALRADVSRQDDCEAMIDRCVEAFGGIDVLVNNAGVMDLNQGVGELDLDVWRRVMAINVDGPLFAMRKAMPSMVDRGGSIINIASVAGLGGGAAGVAYTASKHAVVGMTLNTAWLYGKRGVRCNAIAAGAVRTNIVKSVDLSRMDAAGSARAGEYYALIPTVLEPSDIAQLCLFLASDESRQVNGAIIPADAGWRSA